MTIAKDFASKAVVAFVAAAMLFSFFAPAAQAQSAEDLQAMINNLLAQIASLQGQLGQGASAGGPAGVCPYTWTRDLSQGSTGADVMKLQQLLNSDPDTRVAATGVGSAGMETEYYGPATAAAVSKMQVKYRADVLSPSGLVNPTGFFGPSSRAKANALCAAAPVVVPPTNPTNPTNPTTPTTPGMSSSEANLTSFNFRAGEFVDADEGASDVPVGEIEFDVEDGDIRIDRVDVAFDHTGTVGTADTEPWRVFREVSLWVDGEKVASKRVDSRTDWSRNTPESGVDRLRFTGLDIVLMEDDRAEIVVAVSVQTSVRDTANANWKMFVPVDGIRGRDGAGIDQFIGDTSNSSPTNTVTFGINEEGQDDELRIRKASSDPAAAVLELEDDRTSNYMTVFAFDLDTRDSTSDIQINSLDLTATALSATSTGVSFNDLANDVRLRVGSRTYSRVTVGASGADFTFNDDEFVIQRGQKATVEVLVRFKALTNDLEGSTLKMSLASGDVTAEGTRVLTGGDISGGATGETHTLLTEGLRLKMKSSTAVHTPNATNPGDSKGDFKMQIEVTAVGDTMYVPLTALRTSSTTVGAVYEIQDGNGAVVATGTATAALTRVSGGTVNAGVVEINEGSTATFELAVNYDPTAQGFYRVQLKSMNFKPGTTGTPTETQQALPVDEFYTTSVSIND